MKKVVLLLLSVSLFSCSSDSNSDTQSPVNEDVFLRGADMSYLPLIESEGTVFKHNGNNEDAIITLKNAGCNTIRIRLWQNPSDGHSGMAEVKTFAQRVKAAGLKVWLTVHYSDTWADPAHQTKPAAWQSLPFAALKTAVTDYTNLVMTEINPDIIQIGNETNDGMLWPEGKLSTNENQYLELVSAAGAAIRSKSTTAKIMLHHAGISGSDWYFSKVANIDYDYIGLSYYPIWHGTNLVTLQNTMNALGQLYNKKVVIAETAYPFTFDYNDYTNNIIGLPNQILPAFPATPTGQKGFLSAIKNTVTQSNYGLGFCYWGSEWVAFRGPTATNGSSWENQALWDFNNNSLPTLEVFNAN
ncbi:glycoside hydrolase family 53 protein [Flavobacterium sedimenticola]|uniref:Arabinogalactan endo-beta-1,4-galactanase n=1 Tax=Flavobacterium sedimenticola TaxID=3043286 RepID=A0ABT6XRW3_9FLAO|nr:glycosyl hydrolase 53 family protein [Flavobacterium sedimenticola]MDI9257830.1 glycosyl hydrolase 53 family protein [Flavobacterium sedimenticola]